MSGVLIYFAVYFNKPDQYKGTVRKHHLYIKTYAANKGYITALNTILTHILLTLEFRANTVRLNSVKLNCYNKHLQTASRRGCFTVLRANSSLY